VPKGSMQMQVHVEKEMLLENLKDDSAAHVK
jgi:hypothetical protein